MYVSSKTILNIAMTKERKSIDLYTKLEEKFKDPMIKELVEQEKKHIEIAKQIFDKNSESFASEGFENPYMDDTFLAEAFASEGVYDKIDIQNLKKDELLDVALAKEKDSIVFYTQLIEILGDDYSGEIGMIKQLRDQEKNHIMKIVELKKKK